VLQDVIKSGKEAGIDKVEAVQTLQEIKDFFNIDP